MTTHAIAELIENAGDSIDGAWSPTTAAIKQSLGCDRIDLNSNWALTPQDWRCPACTRSKHEIARVLPQGVIMMHLHRHHDHFDEFFQHAIDLMNEESQKKTADAFYIPLKQTFIWFEPTIVCEDCNALDGAAKNRGKTDRFFSLPPSEIRRVGHVRPNRAHFLDETLMEATLNRLLPKDMERREIVRNLLAGIENRPIFETPVPIVDAATCEDLYQTDDELNAFLEFATVKDAIGTSLKPKNPRRRSNKRPSPADIETAYRSSMWYVQAVPDTWSCVVCARTKRECVVWSKSKNAWNIAIESLKGQEICTSCAGARAAAASSIGSSSSKFIEDVDDLRRVIKNVQPNQTHEIDLDVARELFEKWHQAREEQNLEAAS